jgi:acyl-CoA reductase-like NAD-dependent aldehyde dehydrogenase
VPDGDGLPSMNRRETGLTSRHDNLIGGAWKSGDEYAPNLNPSDLTDVVGEYARASAADAEAAVAVASQAFPAWSRSSPQQRFEILDAIGTRILAEKERLGELLAREEGKTRAEGVGEAARAGQIFKFFAAEA